MADEPSRRRFIRRTALAGLAVGLAGCSGSDDGSTEAPNTDETPSPTEAPTTVPPHTTSEPPGNLGVGADSVTSGSESSHQMTVPVDDGLTEEQLESLAVTYPGGFSVESIDEETAQILVGSEGESARDVPVGEVETTDGDDQSEVTLYTEESETLGESDTVVAKYDGVETPEREGSYTVTATVNDDVTEVGAVEVSDDPIPVESTFEKTTEGWQVAGDAQGNSAFPNHHTERGTPAPCLEAVDDTVGGVWYWVGPTEYTGNKAAYYDGTLSVSLRQSSLNSQFADVDVAVLSEADGALIYDFGATESHPRTEFTEYEIPVTTGDAWRHVPDATTLGAARTQSTYDAADDADEAAFEAVLSDVTALYLRGEYVDGSDTGWLDSVSLSPP